MKSFIRGLVAVPSRTFAACCLIMCVFFVRADAVELKEGDKVVLLGNTFVERAQQYGYVETALTLSAGQKNVTFRNLGWSGDSVFGHARSYFGPPKEGFDRLKKDMSELKPNVVIVCYGAVAAFEGADGLKQFLAGYEKLIEMIQKAAEPREIVLLSSPPAQSMGAPMPDMSEHNGRLAMYAREIAKLAGKKKLGFADLYTQMGKPKSGLTDNGIHYNREGYRVVAAHLAKVLGMDFPEGKLDSDAGEKLRKVIVAKNKLFFHRWRPANETYLRLFRKHEQGKNVKELPMFDPLIAEKEKEIELLREKLITSK